MISQFETLNLVLLTDVYFVPSLFSKHRGCRSEQKQQGSASGRLRSSER